MAAELRGFGLVTIGVVFGAVFKLMMKSVVMPLLGADPINHAYHYLVGNREAIPSTLFAMVVIAGFGEETLFRGFLFERLHKLFGASIGATAAIVVLTSIGFSLAHYAVQGVAAVQQATIVGLVFGAIFATTRSIWLIMSAHASFDLMAYAIIYFDQEVTVARAFFN